MNKKQRIEQCPWEELSEVQRLKRAFMLESKVGEILYELEQKGELESKVSYMIDKREEATDKTNENETVDDSFRTAYDIMK